MAHPDLELKVGATREACGLTWTLYKNQFGLSWKAGARARNVMVHENPSLRRSSVNLDGYRLEGNSTVTYATFDKAAQAAINKRAHEYEQAKNLIAAFDAAEPPRA